jgi:hypothetical protein
MENPSSEKGNILDAKEAAEMSMQAQEIAKIALSKTIREYMEKGMTKEQIRKILDSTEPNLIN